MMKKKTKPERASEMEEGNGDEEEFFYQQQ